MTCWLTREEDVAAVIHRIIDGDCAEESTPDEEQSALAMSAFEMATSILMRGSAFMVHGPGTATDQFIATPTATRLGLTFDPVDTVTEVRRNDEVVPADSTYGWAVRGTSVYFDRMQGTYYGWVRRNCGGAGNRDLLEVTYDFKSTVTKAALDAAVYYARQFYAACTDSGSCELPDRIISMTREGLTFQMVDPQNFLDDGRTGITRVDQWLASVNRTKGMRRSGVFTPDSPPGVNLAVSCAPVALVAP